MSDEVVSFENKMANYVGSKYAVFVSSGSTANALLAMYLKDHLSKKKVIVFPSTTWITSVSRFIREGFTPYFIDISLKDLAMDLDKLELYLKKNGGKVACVFITSLLGFSPDIDRLKKIEKKYKVKIMMDNCESTFTTYKSKNISSYFTSTTSTYFGHHLQSVEGGFIFTNDEREYEYFLMSRNHGMTRSLSKNKELYANPDVDSRFDFRFLGDNYRNTNINAFIGQLDFARVDKYVEIRKDLYDHFYELCQPLSKNVLTIERKQEDVPFSLPFVLPSKKAREEMQKYCSENNIENRPIISGNLIRQTCLKKYGNPLKFTNSEILHHRGLYVGLHSKVLRKNIQSLVNTIVDISA